MFARRDASGQRGAYQYILSLHELIVMAQSSYLSARLSNVSAASLMAKASENSPSYLGLRISIGLNWKPKGYPHHSFLMCVNSGRVHRSANFRWHSMQSKKANFDASVELEELLLEDNPLKAKQRKVNQDNLSPEMKQMEEQCV
jgi:hypothetical protein